MKFLKKMALNFAIASCSGNIEEDVRLLKFSLAIKGKGFALVGIKDGEPAHVSAKKLIKNISCAQGGEGVTDNLQKLLVRRRALIWARLRLEK